MTTRQTVRQRLLQTYARLVFRRDELIDAGWRPRDITTAVRTGRLLRLRRNRYALPDVDPAIADAVRAGGRLCCLSLLEMIGVFVLAAPTVHIHVPPNAGRLPQRPGGVRLHWGAWAADGAPLHVVALADAVLQSVRCQSLRAALATLDSVVHHRLMTVRQLETLFERLPARFAVLLKLVDGSAESGSETFMRLILRALGVRFQTQVVIPSVGRVDFLVEGWLIIECDSKEFHEGWEKQREDRLRDLAAAMQGYVTVRPMASDIFEAPDRLREQLRQVIQALRPRGAAGRGARGVHNSGRTAGTQARRAVPARIRPTVPEL